MSFWAGNRQPDLATVGLHDGTNNVPQRTVFRYNNGTGNTSYDAIWYISRYN